MPEGYMSREYAAAFAEFGAPRQLARSGGWLIERAIAGTQHRDAMGCYPLFGCADWSALAADLDDLKHELVSVALVADPFGKHELAALERAFDVVRPFTATHWGTQVMTVRDPDGRLFRLEAGSEIYHGAP